MSRNMESLRDTHNEIHEAILKEKMYRKYILGLKPMHRAIHNLVYGILPAHLPSDEILELGKGED